MRKPVIAVSTLIAVAASAYTVMWFKKADEFKSAFMASVVSFNEKAKPMLKEGTLFQYGSVDVTGFPFAMEATIHQPVLRLPVSSMLRSLPRDEDAEGKGIPADFDWVEEVSYKDSITLSSNLMGSRFTISAGGERIHKSILAGTVQQTMISTSRTPVECHLTTPPAGFLLMQPVFRDAQSVLDSFRSADCGVTGLSVKDEKGTPIATSEKIFFSLSNIVEVEKANRTAAVIFNANQTNYGTGFDVLLKHYIKIAADISGEKPEPIGYSFAEIGETSMNVDLAYKGPEYIDDLEMHHNLDADIDINAFDFQSALAQSKNKASLHIRSGNDSSKTSISIASRLNVSEAYDAMMEKKTAEMLKVFANPAAKPGAIAPFGTFFPHLHDLGDIALNVDLTLENPNAAAANSELSFLEQGNATLKTFEILTAHHGLKSSGALVHPKDKFPSGNLDIACINCDSLIDGVGGFYIDLGERMKAMAPSDKLKEKKTITKEILGGVKRFVRGISANGSDTNAKDLNISIVGKDTGDFSVSGKSMMDVVQLYSTTIEPHLPQPEADIPSVDSIRPEATQTPAPQSSTEPVPQVVPEPQPGN